MNSFVGNDLIKCGGRLKNAALDYGKFPILRPKDNKLIELLVAFYHLKVLHSGMKRTLNLMTSRFWLKLET